MVKHLFPGFLADETLYAQSEQFWIDLWEQVDERHREANGWRQPWFSPLPPSLGEGNPIFTASSPGLKRGIRILQSEPTENGVEFFAYPDTFGGPIDDPSSIHELVISCALSDAAAELALSMFRPWVLGEPISFRMSEDGLLTPK